MLLPHPRSTLFPYTTLFRSRSTSGIAALIQPGRVHRRVFTDPEIFELEMERIYGRRSEEHTSELQSRRDLVCRLLLEKKKKNRFEHLYYFTYTTVQPSIIPH